MKETSFEVQALVESFKMEYMTEEEKASLKEKISTLDSIIKDTPKKDHYFISKTAIYKWILKNKPNTKVPESFTLTNFKAKAAPQELAPFPRWLLTALRTDTLAIIQDPQYSSYQRLISQKNKSYQNLKIHRRIKLIKPWLYLFHSEGATQVDLRMMKFHFSILNHVIAQLKVFYQFNHENLPSPSQKLTYFSLSDQKPKEAPNEKEALSLLDQVIEKHRKANLPLPTDDWSLSDEDSWTPADNDGELTQLQKINIDNPKPDGSYEAPKSLPEPIDDWVWD